MAADTTGFSGALVPEVPRFRSQVHGYSGGCRFPGGSNHYTSNRLRTPEPRTAPGHLGPQAPGVLFLAAVEGEDDVRRQVERGVRPDQAGIGGAEHEVHALLLRHAVDDRIELLVEVFLHLLREVLQILLRVFTG